MATTLKCLTDPRRRSRWIRFAIRLVLCFEMARANKATGRKTFAIHLCKLSVNYLNLDELKFSARKKNGLRKSNLHRCLRHLLVWHFEYIERFQFLKLLEWCRLLCRPTNLNYELSKINPAILVSLQVLDLTILKPLAWFWAIRFRIKLLSSKINAKNSKFICFLHLKTKNALLLIRQTWNLLQNDQIVPKSGLLKNRCDFRFCFGFGARAKSRGP